MKIQLSEMLGDTMNLHGFIGENPMAIKTSPFIKYDIGKNIDFEVQYKNVVLFDGDTELIIKE